MRLRLALSSGLSFWASAISKTPNVSYSLRSGSA